MPDSRAAIDGGIVMSQTYSGTCMSPRSAEPSCVFRLLFVSCHVVSQKFMHPFSIEAQIQMLQIVPFSRGQGEG